MRYTRPRTLRTQTLSKHCIAGPDLALSCGASNASAVPCDVVLTYAKVAPAAAATRKRRARTHVLVHPGSLSADTAPSCATEAL